MTVNISGDTGVSAVQNNVITADKIASGAVTAADITDGEITNAKIASVDATKLTGAITVDSNGYVTKSNQPCFSAYHSGNINWDAYTTPIVFNGVRFNNGNHYNSSTGQFTAPVSGKYLMNCYLHFMGESSYTFVFSRFRQSGAAVGIEMMRTSARANYDVFGMSTILDLSANDTVDIFIGQAGVNSGYLRGGVSMNKFEGYLIG